jgi:hypothetical protein
MNTRRWPQKFRIEVCDDLFQRCAMIVPVVCFIVPEMNVPQACHGLFNLEGDVCDDLFHRCA